MNATYIRHGNPRLHLDETGALHSSNVNPPRLRETPRFKWIRGISGLAWLGIAISLSGCGGSGSPAQVGTANPTGRPPKAELIGKSSVKCEGSPLVKQWRTYNPTDVVIIDASCVFETQACQTLGYIDSDVSTEVGIAEVVFVYDECRGPGRYRCAYDARNGYEQELHFDCQ